MISINATLASHISGDGFKPVWLLEFDSAITFFSSGTFSGITASYVQAIEDVYYFGTIATPIDNDFPETKANISIADLDGEILKFFANRNILNKTAYLKFGTQLDIKQDFETRFIGKVDEINFKDWQMAEILITSYWPDDTKKLFYNIPSAELKSDFPAGYFHSQNLASTTTSWQTLISSDQITDWRIGMRPLIQSGVFQYWATITDIVAPSFLQVDQTLTGSFYGDGIIYNSYLEASGINAFFSGIDYNASPFQGKFIQVDDEIIEAVSRNFAGNFFVLGNATIANNQGRGLFGTNYGSHTSGAPINELYYLRDNNISLMLNLMTTTTGGTNSIYDLGIDNFCSSIEQSFIDFDAFENFVFALNKIDVELLANDIELTNDIIFNDFMAPFRMMPYINNLGKISAKIFSPIYYFSSEDNLNENDVLLSVPTYSLKNTVNKVEVGYDYVPTINRFKKLDNYILEESIAQYGESNIFKLHSKVLRSLVFGADTVVANFLDSMMKRYGNPPVYINADIGLHKIALEQGDIITITANDWPNISTGNRGVQTLLCQIVSIEIDGFNKINARLELDRALDFFDVGEYSVFDQDDFTVFGYDASEDSNTATYLDPNNDAIFYNSGLIDATDITVELNATFGGPDVAYLKASIITGASNLGGGSCTEIATQSLEMNYGINGFYSSVVNFTGLPLDAYDVKLDFYNSDTGNCTKVNISKITYDQISLGYTKVQQ